MTINYLSLSVSEVHRLAPYLPGQAIKELERELGRSAESTIKLESKESPLAVNPSNPTGPWFQRAQFKVFMDRVPPETLAVLDEAYIEYVKGPALPNGLGYLPRFPNLIVTRRLCKATIWLVCVLAMRPRRQKSPRP